MKKDRLSWYFLLGMIALGGAIVFLRLDKSSFSMDEVSSITISQNWNTMWNLLWKQEGNMWLYYFIMYFILKLSTTEVIVRSFSAICAVLTVPVFFVFAKKLFSTKIAMIATPLLITNLCFVYFAQTARAYSFSLLLTTLSCYLFLKVISEHSSWKLCLLYLIVSVFAVYTYLFAIIIIAIQYLSLLFYPYKKYWKKLFLIVFSICVCLIPLLLSPSLRGGHQLDWLGKPSFIQLPYSIVAISGDFLPLGLFSCLIIAILLWRAKGVIWSSSYERFRLLWLILWLALPICATFIFSLLVKPIYQPQYFNTSLPAFILLISAGLTKLPLKTLGKKAVYGTLLIFCIIRLGLWYSNSTHNQLIFSNTNPWDWKEAANYIDTHGKSTDAIVFYAYYIRNPFEHYFNLNSPLNRPKTIEIALSSYALGGGYSLPEENKTIIKDLSKKYPRVWLVSAYNNTSIQERSEELKEIEQEIGTSYSLTKTTYFNQVTIKMYKR